MLKSLTLTTQSGTSYMHIRRSQEVQ